MSYSDSMRDMLSSVPFTRSVYLFLVTMTIFFDIFWLFQETKLLFDELIFCLQRLYCIPFHLDMPFNSSILEEITTVEVRMII